MKNLTQKTIRRACVACLVLAILPGRSQPAPEAASPDGLPEAPEAAVPTVAPPVAEVIRLAQSGVGEDVVLAYVQNSSGGFNLSADQILYLRDLGISSQVISSMITRDSGTHSEPQPVQPGTPVPASQPSPSPAPPNVPVEAPLTPQAPTEVSTPPVQVNYFYSSLSPYGSWVDLEGVGWCWQPSIVVINRGWQPYCDGGHWVFTDAGWFWRSDYSWGWGPFHYGRWQLHPRCGWVWSPDTVWAPSWVIWRTSGDRCGWAPLPPHAVFDVRLGWTFNGLRVRADFDFGLRPSHFTFVGLHDFNERDLRHRRLPTTEVTKIYNNTTIINNYTVNKTTVINRGIPVERVSSVARTPVQRATVREAPAGGGRANFASARGSEKEAVVYRPVLKAPPRAAPVTVQKVDDRHPTIQQRTRVAVAAPQRTPVQDSSEANRNVRRAQPEISRPSGGRQAEEKRSAPAQERQPFTTRQPEPRTEPGSRSAPQATPSRPPAPVTAPNVPRQIPQQRNTESPGPGSERSIERAPRNYSSEPRGGNAPGYYPKSYRQAEELRPAPSRQSPPPQSQSQGNSTNQRGKKND